ncbi:MAG TPA: hypothetical protein DDY17_03640 [Syntrophaceae bacterium]|jgi:long-subunit fatty acid transport protein|nr:hypothetical protein [Syntrophaceae bacterium]
MKRKRYGFIILLWILLCLPRDGAAGLIEQLTIETRAASLGNAVTADPEGPFSVHYNPAGLDRVSGTTFQMGLFYVPVLNVKGHFTQGVDPSTGKPWAPFGGWFNNGIDPEAGHDSSTIPSMELPFLGHPRMGIAVPNLGFAYHDKDSPFAFGFALYVPFGVGMEHPDNDDPLRFLGQRESIVRLTLGPGISYRVTKSLSIGASFGLGVSYFAIEQQMRAPNEMVALTGALGEATRGLEIPILSELTLPAPWFGGGLTPYESIGNLKVFAEDNMNTSYNIGLLWEPFSWVSFGGAYQSETDADLKGKYTLDYSQRMQNTVNWLGSSPLTIIVASMLGLPISCPPELNGNMSINLVFPARAQFGIKLQPHRRIKFLVDAGWTQWSAWKSIEIVFDRDIELLRLARLLGYTGGSRTLRLENHFKDVWDFHYGLELRLLDPVTLRLGYEFRPTSVSDSYYGPLPMGDMVFYSAGIGIEQKHPDRKFKGVFGFLGQLLKPDRLDLSFTYMTSDSKVRFNQSKNFNSTNFTDIIYSPFAGLEYENKITAYIFSFAQIFYF